jgi:phosphopantothenoylcysteine synthetase/decarboxylase
MGKAIANKQFMGRYSIIETYIAQPVANKVIYVVLSAARKVAVMPNFVDRLKQMGAKVYVFATPNTKPFIGKLSTSDKLLLGTVSFEASGNPISTEKEDLLLFMPCTFNSVIKLSSGLADNYAMGLAQSAIARHQPVIVVPAYHEFWDHPQNQLAIDKLKSWGIGVIYPDITPMKVTMMDPDKVLDVVGSVFSAFVAV